MDVTDASAAFRACFDAEPACQASAHGRVNLLGEHTDYNGGFVLPTLIPQRTAVALRPAAQGQRVRVFSAQLSPPGGAASYELGQEARGGTFLDYVQGVTAALRDTDACAGRLRGFDLSITSTVPPGSGLSSSAALEIALLRALRQAFALPLSDLDLALLGQRAENELVGARVGIMDQLVCSLGERGAALFVDTRSLATQRVPLPSAVELLVIHSGVSHRLAPGGADPAGRDYNTRRGECEQAAAALCVPQLRDAADLPDAAARVAALPSPLRERARHVIAENARVLAAVTALEAGDMATLGRLMDASHRSLRDDYDVSTPEVDALVAVAQADPAVLGARITGGGFGGSIVALCRPGAAAAAGARISDAYARDTSQTPRVLVPQARASS